MNARQIEKAAVQWCVDSIDMQLEDPDELDAIQKVITPTATKDDCVAIRARMQELKEQLAAGSAAMMVTTIKSKPDHQAVVNALNFVLTAIEEFYDGNGANAYRDNLVKAFNESAANKCGVAVDFLIAELGLRVRHHKALIKDTTK